MSGFVPVADASEIPPGTSKVVVVAGHIVALFNVGGSFYALSNTCLHRGGPVGGGGLDGEGVTCPLHGWQDDVRSGGNVLNPLARPKRDPVKLEDGSGPVAPRWR